MDIVLITPFLAQAAATDGLGPGDGMSPLDWAVIGLYAVGMLGVGWYYARRTSTTDDYLLGGRNMSPWMVGLSLFATLLSTLTYLALPGEMIQYGPMVLAQMIALPLVAVVVGRFLIPAIMQSRVTSAYELLEIRIGLSARLLGACIFLVLRLLWMSLVIFATADVVLLPILGLDRSAIPWICAALGLLTVAYTSMGGLRAVVVTDVIQTVILFGGALLTLGLITKDLGGIDGWWPDRWPSHWQEPVFWFDPDVRFTFVGASLSYLTWWVCTAGSDQMAIQRYLATRDARAARQTLNITLIANALVFALLAAVGMALLAYFRARPEMFDPDQTIGGSADQLLPTFIVRGLPPGISGLVIAGLLAAAMSSLSSGLNSACSVITTDFIGRFRKVGGSEGGHLRLAKYVSLGVGVTVVALGALVGQVEGNLLELCFKIANLLVTPLFLLFFMALFIRWATTLGTFLGALSSAAVAVAVAYPEKFAYALTFVWMKPPSFLRELNFIWMMPVSFVVGALVGPLVSLAPIGRRRNMDDE